MCAAYRVRNTFRNLIKSRFPPRYTKSEFATNIFLNWVVDENRNTILAIQRGAMLLFAAMPITWRRENFAKVRIDLSILEAMPDGVRLCALKGIGGVGIAAMFTDVGNRV